MTLVKLGLGLLIAAILFGNLEGTLTALKPGLSSDANTTIDDTISNVWSGMALVIIVIIVVGAAYLAKAANMI